MVLEVEVASGQPRHFRQVGYHQGQARHNVLEELVRQGEAALGTGIEVHEVTHVRLVGCRHDLIERDGRLDFQPVGHADLGGYLAKLRNVSGIAIPS